MLLFLQACRDVNIVQFVVSFCIAGQQKRSILLLRSQIAPPLHSLCWPNLPAPNSRTSLLAVGREPGPRPYHAGHRIHGGEELEFQLTSHS